MCYLRFISSDYNVTAVPPKSPQGPGVGIVMGAQLCEGSRDALCKLGNSRQTSHVGPNYLTNGGEAFHMPNSLANNA